MLRKSISIMSSIWAHRGARHDRTLSVTVRAIRLMTTDSVAAACPTGEPIHISNRAADGLNKLSFIGPLTLHWSMLRFYCFRRLTGIQRNIALITATVCLSVCQSVASNGKSSMIWSPSRHVWLSLRAVDLGGVIAARCLTCQLPRCIIADRWSYVIIVC